MREEQSISSGQVLPGSIAEELQMEPGDEIVQSQRRRRSKIFLIISI